MVRNGGRAHRPSRASLTGNCFHYVGTGLENGVFSVAVGVFKDSSTSRDNFLFID